MRARGLSTDFCLAMIPMEVQLQKASVGNSPFNLSWHVITTAKLQDLLMEQFCTAVNQNKSSERAAHCLVCSNQTYISKLPKYCSGLPQEWSKRIHFLVCLEIKIYSTSITYRNFKSTRTLLLYLVDRVRMKNDGQNQHSSNAVCLLPMHAWEEAVDCSQLPLSVILEKWSPLTRSCYQKAVLQGLLRNICSCLGSTSSSSSTWSTTNVIFARLSHHGATSTHPKSLLAMLSRNPQGIPLWCDYLSLWTPWSVYKAKVGLRLQSKPRKFMCQYCLK